MENILSQFNLDSLDIKLTNEKLIINSPASSESFALRSLNGIGVIDLVDDYNKALTEHKKSAQTAYAIFALGVIFIISGFAGEESNVLVALIGIGVIIFGFTLLNKNEEPTLMSAVRLMMNGGNRDFQFDKTSTNSEEVAEFVAKVESTLTSYK
jgi:hypothetical protein